MTLDRLIHGAPTCWSATVMSHCPWLKLKPTMENPLQIFVNKMG